MSDKHSIIRKRYKPLIWTMLLMGILFAGGFWYWLDTAATPSAPPTSSQEQQELQGLGAAGAQTTETGSDDSAQSLVTDVEGAAGVRDEVSVGGESGDRPEQREVLLRKIYICGVESEKTVTEDVMLSPEELARKYKGWQLIFEDETGAVDVGSGGGSDGRWVLQQYVDDISPLCKENGYFGLTPDAMLALFNGPPQEQNIIQTFYYLDTEKLESRLPQNEIDFLYKGIRIRNVAEYHSVLSTYGEYMRPGEG